jgi:hypothetical protein
MWGSGYFILKEISDFIVLDKILYNVKSAHFASKSYVVKTHDVACSIEIINLFIFSCKLHVILFNDDG